MPTSQHLPAPASDRPLDRLLRGTPVVPGLALGPVLQVAAELPEEALRTLASRPATPEEALSDWEDAAEAVATSYAARAERTSDSATEVLLASAGLARDPGLRSAVSQRLHAGEDIVAAVRGAVGQFADLFTAMGGLMAERATDLRDIERRVLARLAGLPEPGVGAPDAPSVLVADDLAPADAALLDASRVLALVTERGGPTSHTAIIARQLGLPCVVGAAGVTALADGALVLVDGGRGEISVEPDRAEAERRVALGQRERAAVAAWQGPGRTRDGAAVKLLANVGDEASAAQAARAPVEGVGLFRTELCFLGRAEEPDVHEQAEVYAGVLGAFGPGATVVVRTLDAGSDKPIAFATLEGEENPALGVRGLRLAIGNPGLLERQLDAVALAAARTGVDAWVMAPMVATVEEAAGFAALVRARGLRAGVMVEVPSAALVADRILAEVDFLSLGTNDLTQYTMAADRLASDLAHLTDPWQPAVLQLVALTARAGRTAGKPVGVCGEAAADPALACVLVGLGVTSLSMASAAVRPVGARLAGVDGEACVRAAEAALAAADPASARAAVQAVLDAAVRDAG